MISATAGASASDTSSTSVATGVKANDQADRFLKLLVAQMKNQDPLNPLDNAEVTTQMAQISTVSGIEKLNQTLQAFTQAQAFQAVGMIGHHVLAPGNFMNVSSGTGAAGFELSGAADSVKAQIFDANGSLVRTLDLGKRSEGVSVFQWDGKNANGVALPDGAYSFTLAASQAGNSVSATSLALGSVQSVLMDQAGPALSVQGMGLVDLNSVKQIL